jgi:hypothetical protein
MPYIAGLVILPETSLLVALQIFLFLFLERRSRAAFRFIYKKNKKVQGEIRDLSLTHTTFMPFIS